MLAAGVCSVAMMLLPGPARADATATAGASEAGSPGWLLLSAGLAGGFVAGTPTLGLDFTAAAGFDRADVVIGAPVRFELGGRSGSRFRLRTADWDEGDEVLRPLRLVRWHGDRFRVVGGELSGIRLGHGALVRGYVGNPEVDHHAVGLYAWLGLEALEVELLVDDLPKVDVAALRVAWRPGVTRADLGVVRRWTLATTLATDFFGVWQRTRPRKATSEGGVKLITGMETPALAAMNLSADYLWLPVGWLRVTPFAQLSGTVIEGSGVGVGLHAGGRVRASLLGGSGAVSFSAAFVLAGPGYTPGLFGPLYRIERHGAPARASGPVGGSARPLAVVLRGMRTRPRGVFDAQLELGEIRVDAGYETPRGAPLGHRWWVRASLPRVGPVQGAFMVAGDGPSILLGAVEAQLNVSWLQVRASLSREWITGDDGTLEPATSLWIAAAFAASWMK